MSCPHVVWNGGSECICPLPGQVIDASLRCVSCQPGTYGHFGASACVSCDRGMVAEASGSPSCVACPAGFAALANGTACSALCPAAGFYYDGAACQPCSEQCPSGSYQIGGGCDRLSDIRCTKCAPPCADGTFEALSCYGVQVCLSILYILYVLSVCFVWRI